MHEAFRNGFEKIAKEERSFDPKVFGAFTTAGALSGIADAMTSAKPSWKRGLMMAGIGGTMGATEGAHLGDNAPTWARAGKLIAGTGLGGALAYTAGHSLTPGRRMLATGLGALASGIPAAL